jgi:putative ABC transport system permease protein
MPTIWWRANGANGRSFTGKEIAFGTKVAVVGSVIVEELFNGRAGVGETFRIGNVPFTVIGVLDKKGLGAAGRSQDDVVFIPLSAAKSRVLGALHGKTREALDFISIKVSDRATMSATEREIEALLRQRHRIRGDAPSDFRIENPADILFARGAAVRLLGATCAIPLAPAAEAVPSFASRPPRNGQHCAVSYHAGCTPVRLN